MNRFGFSILGGAALLLSAVSTGAADGAPKARVVRSDEALELTMTQNPSLRAAVAEIRRAEAAVTAAEGLYPYVFDADTGYTHGATPLGHSRYYRQDSVSLGAGISKTFSFGATANLHLDGEWRDTAARDEAVTTDVSGNPTFGFGARLSLTQPLIRGFGNRVGLAALRQAQKTRTLNEKQTAVSASALAQEVLSSYWDLWLAARTVDINLRSKEVAAAQLAETETRVSIGDAAPVDKLSYQTRLASLEETVIESEAELRRLEVLLAEKAGVIREHPRLASDTTESLPDIETPPPVEALVKLALADAPAIQQAFASVTVAEEAARTAGESLRQKLDLQGWIEAKTLGADAVSPVVTDLGDKEAYSAYIGLTYELPLDNRQKAGERAQALINVEIARHHLRQAEEQVRSDVAVARDSLVSALKRVDMAEETLRLAKASVEAEEERYRLGAGIFTAVRDAEETLRQAELRLTRARVDAVNARITLDHLTGSLLARLALPE